jgi:hypothetical protein
MERRRRPTPEPGVPGGNTTCRSNQPDPATHRAAPSRHSAPNPTAAVHHPRPAHEPLTNQASLTDAHAVNRSPAGRSSRRPDPEPTRFSEGALGWRWRDRCSAGLGSGQPGQEFMIASFGNLTLVSRVEFPKLAIMAHGSPTCWAGGCDLAGWRRTDRDQSTSPPTPGPTMPNTSSRLTPYQQARRTTGQFLLSLDSHRAPPTSGSATITNIRTARARPASVSRGAETT